MTSSCRSSLLPLGQFAQAGFVNSPAGRKAGLLGTAFGFGPDDPRLYVDVRVDVCVDGCVDVWSLCVDLCVDGCVDVWSLCVDLYVDLCVDVWSLCVDVWSLCVDVSVDGCVDVWSLCVDLYVDLCVDVCLLSRRFGVAFSLIRFGVPHEINEAHQKKYQLFEKT